MNAICSQADFARALSDPELPPPSGLTTARGQLDPARLAVYRNNVHVSLVSALERSFPIIRRVVGERFFAAMAKASPVFCPNSHLRLNCPICPISPSSNLLG
jgi:hypothetical protein